MKVAIVLLFAVAAVMAHPAAEDVEASSSTVGTTGRPIMSTGTTPPSPVEKCPAINGVYVTVIPNPADCTSYFACETGVPILMHCPPGLHFNPVLHVCDLPINAKCQKVEDAEAAGKATTGTTLGTTGRPNIPTGTTPPSPVEKCPAINGVYVTVIPNPADCTSYFACETGVPILMHCPAGLHFNPVLHVCDSPINAKCQKVEDVEAGGKATTGTTGRPNIPTGTTPPSPVEKCPAINGVYVTVIPNPTDCTTYFACETGVPILMHCPAGLHFNPVLHVCDLPIDAKCQKV